MNDLPNSDKIRELSYSYYLQHIKKEEYRRLRKELLDNIDMEMNNVVPGDKERNSTAGIVDKITSYFKKSDKEELV